MNVIAWSSIADGATLRVLLKFNASLLGHIMCITPLLRSKIVKIITINTYYSVVLLQILNRMNIITNFHQTTSCKVRNISYYIREIYRTILYRGYELTL